MRPSYQYEGFRLVIVGDGASDREVAVAAELASDLFDELSASRLGRYEEGRRTQLIAEGTREASADDSRSLTLQAGSLTSRAALIGPFMPGGIVLAQFGFRQVNEAERGGNPPEFEWNQRLGMVDSPTRSAVLAELREAFVAFGLAALRPSVTHPARASGSVASAVESLLVALHGLRGDRNALLTIAALQTHTIEERDGELRQMAALLESTDDTIESLSAEIRRLEEVNSDLMYEVSRLEAVVGSLQEAIAASSAGGRFNLNTIANCAVAIVAIVGLAAGLVEPARVVLENAEEVAELCRPTLESD